MEKPRSETLPPPYSSLPQSHSQEYNVRAPVLATAPYPVTPESDQVPHHMMMPPPPYYYNPMPVGTSVNGIPGAPSNHNPTYTPALYNPAVTVTPTSRQSTHFGNAKNLFLRVVMMVIVIVIMVVIGIGTNYYIQEVF